MLCKRVIEKSVRTLVKLLRTANELGKRDRISAPDKQ